MSDTTVRCRVLRGGRRIVGRGVLPDTGTEIELPDRLARQLIGQRIVEAVAPPTKRAPTSGEQAPPAGGDGEQETR